MIQQQGYVYRITNKINNKWYIGSSRSKLTDYRECLKDGYFGSGRALKKAIEKHGKDNFEKEILCLSENAYETEELILKHLDAKNDRNSYNLKNNGGGCVDDRKIIRTNIRDLECRFCYKKFTKIGLKQHENNCDKNSDKIIPVKHKCQYCGKEIHSNSFERHEKSCEQNPNRVTLKRVMKTKHVYPQCYCILCHNPFKIQTIKQHFATCINNPNRTKQIQKKTKMKCPNCGEEMITSNCRRHMKKCLPKSKLE